MITVTHEYILRCAKCGNELEAKKIKHAFQREFRVDVELCKFCTTSAEDLGHVKAAVKHVCGMQGFGMGTGDVCAACEDDKTRTA